MMYNDTRIMPAVEFHEWLFSSWLTIELWTEDFYALLEQIADDEYYWLFFILTITINQLFLYTTSMMFTIMFHNHIFPRTQNWLLNLPLSSQSLAWLACLQQQQSSSVLTDSHNVTTMDNAFLVYLQNLRRKAQRAWAEKAREVAQRSQKKEDAN